MEIIIFLLFIAIILLIVPVYYILKTISLWIIFKKNGKSGCKSAWTVRKMKKMVGEPVQRSAMKKSSSL